MRIRKTVEDRIIDTIVAVSLTIACFIALYPLVYVFSMSISSGTAVVTNTVRLLPKGFSLDSYKMVFDYPPIWNAYKNTLWYTVVGTLISLLFTITGAYALSRKEFFARKFFMVMILITMMFSGGLIPWFLVINWLGLYNTRWAIVLPAAVSAWNLVITRVFFQRNIPDSLVEAAKIDGYNDIGILVKVVLPLSRTIIAINALFSAVDFWNSYFSALVLLSDNKLKPLQIVLREILILQDMSAVDAEVEHMAHRLAYFEQLKYVSIIVSILPIMCFYPFIQKYFVKGIMIGAIKE